MAEINCPMCGKPNHEEAIICQFCEARLKPVTDESSPSQPSILPDDHPTPKDTGELDPVLPKWLHEIRQLARESADEQEQVPVEEEVSSESGMGDLLAGLQSQPEEDEKIPDWLSTLRGEEPQFAEFSQGEDDQSIPGEEAIPDEPSEADSLSGWISGPETREDEIATKGDGLTGSLDEKRQAEELSQAATQSPASESDLGWSADFETDSTPDDESVDITPLETTELPDWLKGDEESPASLEPAAQPATEGNLSDWLASLGDEGGDEIPPDGSAPVTASEGKVPDWMASQGKSSTEVEQPQTEPSVSEETSVAPAFVNDEGKSHSTDDVDAIFSMEMPDWLSEAGSSVQAQADSALGKAQADELHPAKLPSWVQAMRPVETVISETEGGSAEGQTAEEKGPLAGLRGVLPAIAGGEPSSKPKAYTLKLQASEEQKSSAAMLEQILANETLPKPITTYQGGLSQRFLRWGITLLLMLVVGITVFRGTQINLIPGGASPQTAAALRYVQENLPANAPVLMVFDYESALSGELEAAAAPLVDHMLLLKHPRLTLLASTPIGAGLAEHFMSNTQADHRYQRGQQYVNLGYLPGGAAGILAFAENPEAVKPTGVDGEAVWTTPALQGVSRLSDYAAIILLTDDAERARIWIEQTQDRRGKARFLVISSAQSGPMILPYAQSGQVNGMVAGLDGSAPIELVNSGRPGMVRRYWDAYGFGLLTAVTIIWLASLWSLVSGWQERRNAQQDNT